MCIHHLHFRDSRKQGLVRNIRAISVSLVISFYSELRNKPSCLVFFAGGTNIITSHLLCVLLLSLLLPYGELGILFNMISNAKMICCKHHRSYYQHFRLPSWIWRPVITRIQPKRCLSGQYCCVSVS